MNTPKELTDLLSKVCSVVNEFQEDDSLILPHVQAKQESSLDLEGALESLIYIHRALARIISNVYGG